MKLRAKDVMTTTVVSIQADDHVDQAFALLVRHRVSGLPVLDAEGRLCGFLSELDLLRVLYNLSTCAERVRDYLSQPLFSVREDDPLTEVAETFLSHPVQRLPVVNDDGQLTGVVGRHDLVRAIHQFRSSAPRHREAAGQRDTLVEA